MSHSEPGYDDLFTPDDDEDQFVWSDDENSDKLKIIVSKSSVINGHNAVQRHEKWSIILSVLVSCLCVALLIPLFIIARIFYDTFYD